MTLSSSDLSTDNNSLGFQDSNSFILRRRCAERFQNVEVAQCYSKFRLSQPPPQLVDFLVSLTPQRKLIWDVATGNGQVAAEMAPFYEHVIATDQSEAQIEFAVQKPNISYKVLPAEMSEEQLIENGFVDNSFDLITVSSAIQWLDHGRFFPLVRRLLKKPDGIFACWSIGGAFSTTETLGLNTKLNDVLLRMRSCSRRCTENGVIGVSDFISRNYENLALPLEEIIKPPTQFYKQFKFTADSFIARLGTYGYCSRKREDGKSFLDDFADEIRYAWGNEFREISLPTRLKVGRIGNVA